MLRYGKPHVLEDPTKDVQELFEQLDRKFFQSKLKKNGVLLEWNEKASSTAGYCYQLYDDMKKTKRCYIVLNKPLLMLRKRDDLVDTLLHEMIHAMLYIQGVEERNGGHGPNFFRIMRNINRVAGTNITIHHRFHDAVGHCKDLADLKKKKVKVAYPMSNVLDPNRLRQPLPKSPFRPGVPSPMQTKRYRTLNEIYSSYNNRIANDAVKLIGYDSDSDGSDYDSDSESQYDRRILDWMNYTKGLTDMKPWLRSVSQLR